MRILYVITKANWGGAQRYVFDLACAAHAAGHEVAVAYGEPGLLTKRLEGASIRTIEVAGLGRDMSTRDAGAFSTLRALFRDERPQVVHLNSAKAGGLGALAARLAGVPKIIFTAHGWAWNESRSWPARIAIRTASWLTVLLSHTTICVSRAIAEDIAWIPFTRAKLVVIHNGIQCTALASRDAARQELLPGHLEDFWIGMVSELHPTKRVADAIEAFALIHKEQPRAILVVAGEGQERSRLEALIEEKDLAGRVFLLGFVPDAARAMPAFDVFLHASQSEAFAYVILEAGCAELPVVATSVGGIPEVIANGVCGLLVPPRKPEAIARALTRMFEPGVRNACAHALSLRVRRDFPLEGMTRATLALYES